MEESFKLDTAEEIIERVGIYDLEGHYRERWDALAELSITVDPPDADGRLSRYVAHKGRPYTIEDVEGFDWSAGTKLPPGSYILTWTHAKRVPVSLPITLTRGEALTLNVSMPRPIAVPEGFVYIPKGRFVYGMQGDDLRRRLYRAEPARLLMSKAYIISRDEVTYAQYLDYLEDLTPAERAVRMSPEERVARWATGIGLAREPDGSWLFEFRLIDGSTTRVAHGEPVPLTTGEYVDWTTLPVAGVMWDDALAYVAWLDRTSRVPGARLCDEFEWERAARGADHRS